ncbi:MAG: hypothetical protein RIG67_31045 [Rhodospirillales bacterium]
MPLTAFLAGLLILAVALVETVNWRRTGRLTFLSAANALIVVGYALPAFILWLAPGTAYAEGLWHGELYILRLARTLSLPDGAQVSSMVILLGAYAVMVAAYAACIRLPVGAFSDRRLPTGLLWAIAGGLGGVAITAILLYGSQFQDLRDFFTSGWLVRTGKRQVHLGFLQVLAQLGLPAFLVAVAIAVRTQGWARRLSIALACLAFAAVLARSVHVSSRLESGATLFAPVLAGIFLMRMRRWTYAATGAGVAAVLLLAAAPYHLFIDPMAVLPGMVSNLFADLDRVILYILKDFSFPHLAAAHTLTVVPDQIPFRYFIDVPLGALYMLPNFSGVETLPPMILSLHVQLLRWIPVDLFSFGYYSLGTSGVLITFAVFGAALALFDLWLTESVGWLGQALRAAWLFYLPFRLFYADPYAAAQTGFGLIIGTLIILLASRLSHGREK